ncbi:biotin/lipoyl-containing protein [Arundinibacter roseus]|uniref:Acetyl-CoA carboxylase biotin carboxyl carrier protein subunit n=1 Tax=Arundinibacter roseus TaxID=2070510 RepID=A0A4R4JYF2_9BACT|nr:acetyl-CoA carboxylase biotin carboxyl carrier protein subunit [Arundinibacter roseus]TDB58679.1 acetyl-CoA carboxylase biotin carboxyl carrier protein subunit [Arundinibacter roseus]
MLKISINDAPPLDVSQEKGQWIVDGTAFSGDLLSLRPNHFHVLHNHRSYNVEVIEHDPQQKKSTLRINGALLQVSAQDRFDLLLESLGMSQATEVRINEVKAPMPGLIQSVAVQAGDSVKKGDILLVLVAMKMENAIKATGDGTVKTVKITPGSSVEKNQVLIEFE